MAKISTKIRSKGKDQSTLKNILIEYLSTYIPKQSR